MAIDAWKTGGGATWTIGSFNWPAPGLVDTRLS